MFQDKNFNCDGHKGRYWSEHAAFQSAKRLYEDAMKDGRCRFVELSQPPSCSAAFRSVSVTDNSHGGVAEIIDGPRDGHDSMGNIFEFQSQFPAHSAANENEFPAGSFR